MMDIMSGHIEENASRIPKAELPEALFEAWERAPEAGGAAREPPRRSDSNVHNQQVGEELIKHHIKEHWRRFAPDGGNLDLVEFGELLKSCTGEQGAPPAEVVKELVGRICRPSEDEVSQQRLILYLLDYQGLIEQTTQLAEIAAEMVEWERVESPASDSGSERSSDSGSSSDEDEDEDVRSPLGCRRPTAGRRAPTVRDTLQRRLPGFFYQL